MLPLVITLMHVIHSLIQAAPQLTAGCTSSCFQAMLAWDTSRTFSCFFYPQNGIQWTQATTMNSPAAVVRHSLQAELQPDARLSLMQTSSAALGSLVRSRRGVCQADAAHTAVAVLPQHGLQLCWIMTPVLPAAVMYCSRYSTSSWPSHMPACCSTFGDACLPADACRASRRTTLRTPTSSCCPTAATAPSCRR